MSSRKRIAVRALCAMVMAAICAVSAFADPSYVHAQASAAAAPSEPAYPVAAPPPSAPAYPSAAPPAPPPAQGQWVNTSEYGMIWIPAGATSYAVQGVPSAYLYTPRYGWTWYASPWGWGSYAYGPWVAHRGPFGFGVWLHGQRGWGWHGRPAGYGYAPGYGPHYGPHYGRWGGPSRGWGRHGGGRHGGWRRR